ncbi:MAG: peptidoglycan DD-metalloendopeptidase family protein [Candidatus Magasanikbacteria bacterium]
MKNSYKTFSLLFFICVMLVATGFLFLSDTQAEKNKNQDSAQKNIHTKKSEIKKEPKIKRGEKYVIKPGDTFGKVSEKLGIGKKDMLAMVSSSESVYDLTNLSVGQPLYKLTKGGDFVGIDYEINSEEKVLVKSNEKEDSFDARKKEIDYRVETSTIQGTISSSLFKAGKDAGMSDELILDFAEIFAWSVDFAVETKPGDKFKLIYEKRFRDGKKAGPGDILAAKVINQDEEFNAFLFHNKEGEKRYYNEKGESMRRQFLKAPLRYDRISSGYTNARFHPTLGKNLPHKAIDYAAERGTPIRAVGDGTIVYSGWKEGYGYYINIRHNGTFSTQYAHLSGFAKKVDEGVKVKQGQIIGYVGSTGFSTGPHLHYQIKKYGSKVNPLEVDLPKGKPVPKNKRDEFNEIKKRYINKLKL